MSLHNIILFSRVLCAVTLLPMFAASAQQFPSEPFNLPTASIWPALDNFRSDIVSVERIGSADDNSVLRAIKVSDNAAVDEDEPKFLFTGIIHGKEVLGLRAVLGLVENLVNGYDSDPEIKEIVNRFEIWVIPVLNPVGYEFQSTLTTDNDLDGLPDYDQDFDGVVDPEFDLDGDGELDSVFKNGLRKNGPNIANDLWNTGVDLAGNFDFRFNRCNHDNRRDCNDPSFRKYRGQNAESEPESEAIAKLVRRLKPLFGITFHAGQGDRRGKVFYPYRTEQANDRDYSGIVVQESPERDQARYIAQRVLAPAILNHRRSRDVLCDNGDDHDPCRAHDWSDDPFYAAYGTNSTFGTWSNAATGMIDYLIETHSTLDKDRNKKFPSFREGHLYEANPTRTPEQQRDYEHAQEYAANHTEGMMALLRHSSCLTPSGTPTVKGPGITGRILDPSGSPLQATIRVVELDESLIPGLSPLHADFTDLNTDGIPENPVMCTGRGTNGGARCDAANQTTPHTSDPITGTDFFPRTADQHGRFNRLLPTGDYFSRRIDGATTKETPPSEYTIKFSMAGYKSATRTVPIDGATGRDACLTEIDDIVLEPVEIHTCRTLPLFTSHADGATLSPYQDLLEWTVGDNQNCFFTLEVRDTPFPTDPTLPDINPGQLVELGTQTAFELSGYPNDGSEIYVRLNYGDVDEPMMQSVNHQFKAPEDISCSIEPTMTSHVDGASLEPGVDTLSWTSNGCHFWVWIGDAPDKNNYHNQSMAGANSVTLTGYPSDGSDVVLTLLHRNTNNVGAPWKRSYFSFHAPQ